MTRRRDNELQPDASNNIHHRVKHANSLFKKEGSNVAAITGTSVSPWSASAVARLTIKELVVVLSTSFFVTSITTAPFPIRMNGTIRVSNATVKTTTTIGAGSVINNGVTYKDCRVVLTSFKYS